MRNPQPGRRRLGIITDKTLIHSNQPSEEGLKIMCKALLKFQEEFKKRQAEEPKVS